MEAPDQKISATEVTKALGELGYAPETKEKSVTFKNKAITFAVLLPPDQSAYLRVTIPSVYQVAQAKERVKLLDAMVASSAMVRVAKVILVKEQVWITYETYLQPGADLKEAIKVAIPHLETLAKEFFAKISA